MRRLLLVSYCFPPILTAEAILVARTVRALDDFGWPTTVLTVDERTAPGTRDEELLRTLPRSIEIHKAPSRELALHRLRRLPLRGLLWLGLPEEQLLWYPAAVRTGLDLMARERFDAMLSWASFHVSNVVGLRLKHASRLPWAAHLSDPWVASPYFPSRPLQRITAAGLERAIFGAADALVFTTREAVDLVMRAYPATWRDKAVVVPHGYQEPAAPAGARAPGGPLRVVYTGQFYKGKRTPLPFLEALAALDRAAPLAGRLHVVFVGPTLPEYVAAARRLRLDSVVEFLGPRSSAEAQRIAGEADALLVIDAASSGPSVFLPSKLVEYLALRKPILGVTPSVGATAELLARAGCPTVEPDDVRGIAEAIRALLNQYEAAGRVRLSPPSALAEIAPEYEIHATTGRLAATLEAISSTPR